MQDDMKQDYHETGPSETDNRDSTHWIPSWMAPKSSGCSVGG